MNHSAYILLAMLSAILGVYVGQQVQAPPPALHMVCALESGPPGAIVWHLVTAALEAGGTFETALPTGAVSLSCRVE